MNSDLVIGIVYGVVGTLCILAALWILLVTNSANKP